MCNEKTAIIFFLFDTIEEIDTKSEEEEKEMSIELVLPAEELFHLKDVCVFFFLGTINKFDNYAVEMNFCRLEMNNESQMRALETTNLILDLSNGMFCVGYCCRYCFWFDFFSRLNASSNTLTVGWILSFQTPHFKQNSFFFLWLSLVI